MIKINLKQALSFLLLSQLIGLSTAMADTGETLKKLYEMRTISYAILGDYYMFSGLEGDSRYSRDMNTGVKAFEAHLEQLPSDLAANTEMTNNWKSYRELIETNQSDFLSQGYANARLVGQLGTKAIELNESLAQAYANLQSSSGYSTSKWTQITRDMGLIIGTITAEYAARGTSSMGQIMTIQINGEGMDHQAKRFDKLLTQLKTAPNNDKAIFKSIDQVGVKWSFIAKSVTNYNQNSVPFIVNSYGDRINKNLEAIGNHYANTQG